MFSSSELIPYEESGVESSRSYSSITFGFFMSFNKLLSHPLSDSLYHSQMYDVHVRLLVLYFPNVDNREE